MTILQRLAKLLDVKSLVTLALVLVLCIMTLSEREVSELFSSSVMLVLGFFFGKQIQRDNGAGDLEKNQAEGYLGGK